MGKAWAWEGVFATGRLQEAAVIFEALLQENERLTAAYDWLARTLQSLDQGQEAQEVLQRAVALSPQAILRQKALGELAMKNGDNAVAEQAFSQAVRLGRNSVYKAPGIFANLARVKSRCGDGKSALKIVDTMERSSRAQMHLSFTRRWQGELSTRTWVIRQKRASGCGRQASCTKVWGHRFRLN